nr:methyltransferase [uncultured Litoreibacter sp.]
MIASRRFQTWAAHFPFTRNMVRREGEALFDVVAGFCHSQVLMALVQLQIFDALMLRPETAGALARKCAVPDDRMAVLLRAGVALKLLKKKRGDRFAMTSRGAALVGVPGLTQMIIHHDVFYRDLADPVAFFRGEVETELADFWPYVFGGEMDPQVAANYSDLMAQSQILVAEDTLKTVSFKGTKTLMDVGGGTGAFLEAAGRKHKELELKLFDLPQVAPAARERFAMAGMSARSEVISGSFRLDAIPHGADTLSLVRVLYDHSDDTVRQLLQNCYEALPNNGQLVISEPMSGGDKPQRATDVYFALYTMAMRTGRTRSAAEIAALCTEAGFSEIRIFAPRRPFVTSCLGAKKL